MKFKFHISKIANFFHILDSVSEWDICTRRSLRELFVSKYTLNTKDNEYLSVYKGIRSQYKWGGLDPIFTLAKGYDDAFSRMARMTSKKDARYVKQVFDHFYNRLDSFYRDFRPLLIERKKELENEAKKYNLDALFYDAAKFYKKKISNQAIGIYLLPTGGKGHGGGGANLRSSNVTLECRNLGDETLSDIKGDLRVLCHEGIHATIEDAHNLRDDIYHLVKRDGIDRDDLRILTEAIVDTLAPSGFLSLKYGLENRLDEELKDANENTLEFKGDKRKLAYYFRKKVWAGIYELSKKQIESEKSIYDGNFINEAAEVLKKVKKKLPNGIDPHKL